MTKSVVSALLIFAACVGSAFVSTSTAVGQDAILAEMYGRGVHAYYAGNHSEARTLFSSAIDNGSKDPRAYYFRGLVAHQMGSTYEAENDWRQGAELEAKGQMNPAIGRSLSRFQGSARLKLEQIRQTARLQHLAQANARSEARYGELRSGAPAAAAPNAAPAAIPAGKSAIAPPAAPPAANDNPFADDGGMAAGEPSIESDDALKEAIEGNPFAKADDVDAGAASAADAAASPFETAPAANDNPFGEPAGAGAMDNPFGDSPF